jgi:voltage-gated potassium channel
MRPSAAMAVTTRVTGYDLFILALSICAIVALAVQSTFVLTAEVRQVLNYADLMVCAVFLGDFVHSVVKAEDRWRYVRTWGWVDLLSCVPAVDALRVGRMARIVRILRVIRGVRSARAIVRYVMERRTQSGFLAATLLTIVFVTLSSIAILQFEVPVNGNIRTAQDAVWWSLSTMSTLGYGDVYPTTPEGRLIAVFLMAIGVGVFGTMAGLIATWFLNAPQEESQDLGEVRALLLDISARLPGGSTAPLAMSNEPFEPSTERVTRQ